MYHKLTPKILPTIVKEIGIFSWTNLPFKYKRIQITFNSLHLLATLEQQKNTILENISLKDPSKLRQYNFVSKFAEIGTNTHMIVCIPLKASFQ